MEEYIIYVAKSGICLGVFLIIYTLFLRKTTFFKFNRIFLMFGLIASIIIPSVKYTYDVIVSIPVVSVIDNAVTTAAPMAENGSSVNIWTILIVLYVAGILLLSGRNLYTYLKLSRLVVKGTKYPNKGFKLIENEDIKSPFTFLNYILINSNKLSQTEQSLIIKHEQTHINQKHWIDLLCCECLTLIQWFNPVAWVYVHLLKENHEFLADKAVIDSGISPALYQAVLINQEFQGPVFSFSNSFNYLKPLNRLNMIKRNKSAAWKRLAALTIVPLFGVFFWASAEPNYIIQQPEQLIPRDGEVSFDITMIANNQDSLPDKRNIFVISGDSLNGKVIKVSTTTTSDIDKPLFIMNGEKVSHHEMKNIDYKEIDNISVLKDSSSIATYGKDGKNGVIIINTKKYIEENPDKATALHKKQNKDSSNIQSSIRVIGVGYNNIDNRQIVIIDGKKSASDALMKINPNEISSINVLKDQSATVLYGKEGKNGAIEVYTKKYMEEHPEAKLRLGSQYMQTSPKDSPVHISSFGRQDGISVIDGFENKLIILNEKEATAKEVDVIPVSDIESLSVLKEESAIKLYGDKGKNGVIVISTKKTKLF